MQRANAQYARLYAKQGRWADAAERIAEVLADQHPDPPREPGRLAAVLAAALEGKADPAVAEPLLRECRDAVNSTLYAGDWLSAEVASRYGDCLRRQEKYAEAEPILIKAANDIEEAKGVPAWGVAASRKRVADLYEDLKKLDEAAKWR